MVRFLGRRFFEIVVSLRWDLTDLGWFWKIKVLAHLNFFNGLTHWIKN